MRRVNENAHPIVTLWDFFYCMLSFFLHNFIRSLNFAEDFNYLWN